MLTLTAAHSDNTPLQINSSYQPASVIAEFTTMI